MEITRKDKEGFTMERTIRVTGKGKISVAPDMIRLLITQSSVERSYEGAIRESADRKNELNAALSRLDFKKEDLKTLYFDVNTEYESYQAKDKSWKRRLVGYKYTHRMKLEFSKESNLLGKVLGTVAGITGETEFSLQYTISNPEAAKNELLGKAVEDSKAKAKVLTEAAGVELGNILTIDYSWGEIDFVSRPTGDVMLRECCMEEGYDNSIDIDIEADDIDVTDTVTVVWAIK